jgi:HEAT repeat protein
MHDLYVELGRECSRCDDPAESLESLRAQTLIAQIREREEAIADAQNRLDGIAREKVDKKEARKAARMDKAASRKENIFLKALGRASARVIGEKAVTGGAFKDLSDQEIFERVARYLLNDEVELRILLIKGLGRSGDTASAGLLVDSLTDSDAQVRIAALDALSVIRDADSVEAVLPLLSDGDTAVRLRALETIRNITNVQTEFDVHADGVALNEWLDLLKRSLEPWFSALAASRAAQLEEAAVSGESDETDEDAALVEDGSAPAEEAGTAHTDESAPSAEETASQGEGEERPESDDQDDSLPVWNRKYIKKLE